jgi:hypothetical protein
MTARWEQEFDFYLTTMDDKQAGFVVDLAAEKHAPVATHPLRLVISIPMLHPTENGLRSRDELEPLGVLEDRIVERLESAVDAIYAGRVVHEGATVMFLYLPDEHKARVQNLLDITGGLGDYHADWRTLPDPEWECYFEFLRPGRYDRQFMLNRRLQEIFEEKGDCMEIPREIDHVAFFPSEAQAQAALAELQAAGFRGDPLRAPAQEGGAWALEFHRDDVVADEKPDLFCCEILGVLERHEGEYDGWGATLVTPDAAEIPRS